MKNKLLVSTIIAGVTMSGSAVAATVQYIDITGNKRVEDGTVFSYLNVNQGGDYNPADASKIIKTLYRTGLFKNVEIGWDGSKLTIKLEENALVNKVAIEGNEEIDGDRLKNIITMKSRVIYTPEKIQNDKRAILAYYRQSGRFLTKVTPQIIERDQNRVDVIYKVEEGEETKIHTVRFVGNKKFSDADLKAIVRTKESRWWRFLSSSDVYDPARIDVDKEMLRRYYISRGYADFRVVSAVSELSKDKTRFFVTYTVSEGSPYTFGELDVRVDAVDEDVDKQELLDSLSIAKGNSYNGALVEKEVDNFIDLLGSKGFAFLDIKPKFEQNEAEGKIDITFNVVPGPRVYVNRINIEGNDRTRDNVIRREIRFSEGDAFSTNKLKRSRDRLTYLSFFEDVEVKHSETDSPDKIDIDIKVAEQSTGEFNIGAGFSSYEGALASADIKERNFLGKGQEAVLGFSLSKRRQNFNFSFTEPWFLNQELAAGVDLFNDHRDMQSESSYDVNRMGGALRLGFPVNEYTKNNIRLGFKETEINNVDADASTFIKREEGTKDALMLSNTYAIDTRDSAITPTHGHRIALTTEYSGFGTDVSFVRGQVQGSWHKELKDDWVLSLGATVGAVSEIDKDLPIFEHFNAGGHSLRGFDWSGIGPRDRVTGDALGGKYLLTNNAEISFPLGDELKEMGIHGLFFADGGIVTEFDDHPDVIDTMMYRVSAGAGVYWRSPMGPLRFEFGLPIVKAEEDETRVFSFSFGTRF